MLSIMFWFLSGGVSDKHCILTISCFSQKTGFEISCKLPSVETVCNEYQILFSGKNKKNISKCRLLKIFPKVLSINSAC